MWNSLWLVHMSEVIQHGGNELLRAFQAGHIGGIPTCFDSHGVQLFFHRNHVFIAAASAKSDVTAFLGETEGNGATDAACGTGYNGYFVF